MKAKSLIYSLFAVFCLISLFGCDPIYPPGNIKVSRIGSISVGESVDVEITYPYTGGTIVVGWEDNDIEIISGDDVVSVSGFTITGLKAGTAVIKVSVMTVISDDAVEQGYEIKEYSVEIRVKVIDD